MNSKHDNVLAAVGKYSSLAMIVPSAAFAGYVTGYLLDKLFHTGFLTTVLLVLGIIGGLVEVVRTLLREPEEP